MPTVKDGTFLYVEFMTTKEVETLVSIKGRFDLPDVTCRVSQGDILLVRDPDKLYVSFKAQTDTSKFFIHA